MKRNIIDIVGYVFGALVLAMIVVAVVFLVRGFPGIDGSWSFGQSFGSRFQEGGEERVEGRISDLTVSNIAGSITVTGWSENYILIRYTKSAWTEEELSNLQVVVDSRGDSVNVKSDRKVKRAGNRGSISFDISVPEEVVDIRAESISGSVTLQEMSDKVRQTLKSVSGRVATDMAADLNASSVSGSVEFRFSGSTLDAHSTSGSVTGEIIEIDDKGSVDLGSISGSVRLKVPEDFDARVNLHSLSGSVSSELPVSVTNSKRNRLEGVIGDGTIPLEIGTTSGSIRLEVR